MESALSSVMALNTWRKNLLQISTDPLMHELLLMEKSIRRDAHKTKAFARFRLVREEQGDHYIARRFAAMMWTILTPDESLHWDGVQLIYGPGVEASQAPEKDDLEDLWRSYYRATFNPARIKIKAMKREMPVRHWQTLPETDIIADMLAEAPARIEAMIVHQEGSKTSAADFMPKTFDLRQLRKSAADAKVASFIGRQRKPYLAKVPIRPSLCWSESSWVMTKT